MGLSATTTFSEKSAWSPVTNGWQPLYAAFDERGMSIESHQFSTQKPLNWAPSFHPGALEICINTSGVGHVGSGSSCLSFQESTQGFYFQKHFKGSAERHPGEHRFITVELTRGYLATQAAGIENDLRPEVREWLEDRVPKTPGLVQPLTQACRFWVEQVMNPPEEISACALWYQAKALEMVSHILTQPRQEFFCESQKRLNRNRIYQVKQLLVANMENPPDLADLAKQVGCSPFYLSRQFSKETGSSIPKFLKQIRLEKAAELLRDGRHNVTEAALAVGYNSLSHFSKAFCEVHGVCPCVYPIQSRRKPTPP